MSTFGDIEELAKAELAEEQEKLAKSVLKERLREIRQARRVLAKLESQYEELLKQDVDEFEGA